MKRDKALIRQVLRHFEAQPDFGNLPYPAIDNVEAEMVAYHVHLCVQAGFLDVTGDRKPLQVLRRYRVAGLTWKGHELLDPNDCEA